MLDKVRGEAHQALAEVFARRGLTGRALRQLRHYDAVRRARAAEMLGNLRLAEAVGPVCQLLADRRPEVRVVAVRALGAIGHPDAAGPLIDALAREVPAHMVADALARIGQPALPAVQAALRSDAPVVRVTALDALGLIGATGSVAAVVDLLADEADPEVRVSALAALGRLGGRSAVPPLVDALAPANPTAVRAAAARGLGDVGAVAAADALAALLSDAAYRVAHEAADSLVRLGPAGLKRLRDDAETGGPHAREALALADLTGSAG
jgi:HEAT repeat protein